MEKSKTNRRYWLITWNNPPEDWINSIQATFQPDWWEGQLEKGENGTPHIQALLFFSERASYSKFKNTRVHAEPIRGTPKQAHEYVTKESTRIEGPHKSGEYPKMFFKSGAGGSDGNKYDRALELLKERKYAEVEASVLIPHYRNLHAVSALFTEAEEEKECRGLWIFGKPGCGKTHYARQAFPGSYLKAQNKWWDGYNGEATVILDDLDRSGTALLHHIKIWADKYPLTNLEIKGSYLKATIRKFIVTSNYVPSELTDDPAMKDAIQRRFKFIWFRAFNDPVEGTRFGEIPEDKIESSLNYFDIFKYN